MAGRHITEQGIAQINVDQFADLSTAVTVIDTAETELIISEAESVTSNLTIPENITLKFARDGQITVSSGVTLIIEGDIEAGYHQIFSTSDLTSIDLGASPIERIYPQWWGAVGDNSNDDYDAINKAMHCAVNTTAIEAKTLFFPPGNYKITNTLYCNSYVHRLEGIDRTASAIIHDPTISGTPAIVFEYEGYDTYYNHARFKKIGVTGNSKSSHGLKVLYQSRFRADDCSFAGSRVGVHIDNCMISQMSECVIQNSGGPDEDYSCLEVTGANTTFEFENCWFEGTGHGIHFFQGGISNQSGSAQFSNCVIQSNHGYGLLVNGGSVSMQDCHFEGNWLNAIKQIKPWLPGGSPDSIQLNGCVLFGGQTVSTETLVEIDYCRLTLNNCPMSSWTVNSIALTSDPDYAYRDALPNIISARYSDTNGDNISDPLDLVVGRIGYNNFKQRSYATRCHSMRYTFTSEKFDFQYGGSFLVGLTGVGISLPEPQNDIRGQQMNMIYYNHLVQNTDGKLPRNFLLDAYDNKLATGNHGINASSFQKQRWLKTMEIGITSGSMFDQNTGYNVIATGQSSGATGHCIRGLTEDGITYLYIAQNFDSAEFEEGETITTNSTLTEATISGIKDTWVEVGNTTPAIKCHAMNYMDGGGFYPLSENSSSIQVFYPYGGDRKIKLPEPIGKSVWYQIFNTNTSGSNKVQVYRADETTLIAEINPEESDFFLWDSRTSNERWIVGINRSLTITSEDGTQYKLTVENDGALTTTAVSL